VKKQFLVVTAPIANLRKEPVEALAEYVCDDLQETQLLYNEGLLYKEENEDWYYVEAAEQKKATCQDDWQGYPGWIQKTSAIFIDAWPAFNAVVKLPQVILLKDFREKTEALFTLSIGTRLAIEDKGNNDYYKTTLNDGRKGWIRKDDLNIPAPAMDTTSLRKNIIETTKLFLGMPYLWGGRSGCVPQGMKHSAEGMEQGAESGERKPQAASHRLQESGTHKPRTPNTEPRTVIAGVDCSSLTNLAYRVNWLDIPRDAHDQWCVSTHIAYDSLAPADLIFVSAEDVHDKITHVMMYLAGEEFVEALATGSVVFVNTFKNKFGVTLREAAQQDFIVNKRKIHFASVLIAGGKK
jgi:cell wall-associated NlpC family hydrolase